MQKAAATGAAQGASTVTVIAPEGDGDSEGAKIVSLQVHQQILKRCKVALNQSCLCSLPVLMVQKRGNLRYHLYCIHKA